MIAPWPHESPYKDSINNLHAAIGSQMQKDMVSGFFATKQGLVRGAVAYKQAVDEVIRQALADLDVLIADLDYNHSATKKARNIRDDLAAIIDESARP